MSRRIDDLDPHFRPMAMELLARLMEARIYVVIIDTLRTPEEHARNLAAGVSWTSRSLHLDGMAIDLCPVALLHEKGWAPDSPLWLRMGEIGERLGLRWGGRWKQRDMSHLEWRRPDKIVGRA